MAKRFRDAFRTATNEEPGDDDESEIQLKNIDSESDIPESKTPGKPASKAAPKPMPKQPKEKKAPESL